jgi:hypothetical protein
MSNIIKFIVLHRGRKFHSRAILGHRVQIRTRQTRQPIRRGKTVGFLFIFYFIHFHPLLRGQVLCRRGSLSTGGFPLRGQILSSLPGVCGIWALVRKKKFSHVSDLLENFNCVF